MSKTDRPPARKDPLRWFKTHTRDRLAKEELVTVHVAMYRGLRCICTLDRCDPEIGALRRLMDGAIDLLQREKETPMSSSEHFLTGRCQVCHRVGAKPVRDVVAVGWSTLTDGSGILCGHFENAGLHWFCEEHMRPLRQYNRPEIDKSYAAYQRSLNEQDE